MNKEDAERKLKELRSPTVEYALKRAQRMDPRATQFVVRHWDGFDGEWMDVTGPLGPKEAQDEWAKRTENGTKNTLFSEIDYYAIYPAGTVMHFSEEGAGSMRGNR